MKTNSEKLSKKVPIRYLGMTWIPLFIILALPSTIFFVILKIILVIWILITIVSAFKPQWDDYETLGAFVSYNTVLFALLFFLNVPGWLNTIFVLLIMISLGTMFNHINEKNKLIDDSLKLEPEDSNILQKYLGTSHYTLDTRKMNLVTDEIDIKQWQINMEFILRNIDPTIKPEYVNLVTEDNIEFFKKVTPKLRLVLQGINSALYYPLFFTNKVVYSWFIAAYPDVLDYFYPSPNYMLGSKKLDSENKRVEKRRTIVDPIMDSFSNYFQEKYKAEIEKMEKTKGKDMSEEFTITYLTELKDYYKNTLKESLLLKKD